MQNKISFVQRINYITLVIGRRGTGKSYYLINSLIPSYINIHNDKKVLVVDVIDNPLYKLVAKINKGMIGNWRKPSIYRVIDTDINSLIKELRKLKNSLIIFEDASKYFRRQLSDDLRSLMLDSKQNNVDIILVFHGFSFVPPELFRISDGYLICKSDNPVYRRSDIVAYDDIKTTWEKVMASKDNFKKELIWIY